MQTHEVIEQFWDRDIRPSRKRSTMGADGGPVPVLDFSRLMSEVRRPMTERGAKRAVTRNVNEEMRCTDAEHETHVRETDGVTVHYVYTRSPQGIRSTFVTWYKAK